VLGGPGITQAPVDLALGDVDGDGDLDIAVADEGGSDIKLFCQVTPGSFALAQAIGGPGKTDRARSVEAVDLDADGDVDLVCEGTLALTLFVQESPGAFADALVLATASPLFSAALLKIVDLDADGDLDLLTLDGLNATEVLVVLQEAPGAFSAPIRFGEETGSSREILLDDLDGNGLVDVASNASGKLNVYYQGSPGSFSASADSGPAIVSGPIGSSDIDGDGDLELIEPGFDELSIFPQSSPGLLASPRALPGPVPNFDPLRHVAITDLEGDGDADLVSAHSFGSTNSSLFVYFQSAGAYSRTIDFTPPGFPRTLLARDFDGDGLVDLYLGVVRSSGSGLSERLIYFQEAEGAFSAPVFIGGQDTPFASEAVDVDSDGDVDLVTANRSTNDLTVYLQTVPRSFSEPTHLGGPGITEFPVALEAADLDRDGDMDLVCLNTAGSLLTVFLQDSPGSFAAPLAVGGNANGTIGLGQLEAIDIDGDEDLDLVSNAPSGGGLLVLYRSAQGSFGAPVLMGGPGSFVLADVDGDGTLDIAQSASEMQMYFQELTGSFSASLSLGGISGSDLAVADLDADGDLDLVSAGFDGATSFLQRSPGCFSPPVPLAGKHLVKAADLDADGDIDLVLESSVDSQAEQLVVLWGGR
jgi:hypothetical protein